jgi:AbrB family looped-hinge helix DNA binding protein
VAYVVGPKGQVVIAKEIRKRLGVEPGWMALQRLVDDHVELYFLPPEHRRSLKGSLSEYVRVHIAAGEEWDRVRNLAWVRAAEERAKAEERAA